MHNCSDNARVMNECTWVVMSKTVIYEEFGFVSIDDP